MSRPHTCPVCAGTGTVSRPPWVPGDVASWSTTGIGSYSCQACAGSGVVWSPPVLPAPDIDVGSPTDIGEIDLADITTDVVTIESGECPDWPLGG